MNLLDMEELLVMLWSAKKGMHDYWFGSKTVNLRISEKTLDGLIFCVLKTYNRRKRKLYERGDISKKDFHEDIKQILHEIQDELSEKEKE